MQVCPGSMQQKTKQKRSVSYRRGGVGEAGVGASWGRRKKKPQRRFPTYRSGVPLLSAAQSILLDPGGLSLRQQSAIGEESLQAAVSAGGPGRELQRREGLARRGFAANDVKERLLEEREVGAVARAPRPTAAFEGARLAGALAASVSRPQEQRDAGLARLAFAAREIVVVLGAETQEDAQVRVSAAARRRQTQVLAGGLRRRRRRDAGVAQATLLGDRGDLEEREGGVVVELGAELRLVLGYGGGGADAPRGREAGGELSVLAQPAGVDDGGAPSTGGAARAGAELCAQRRPPKVALLAGVGAISQQRAAALELMEGDQTQNQSKKQNGVNSFGSN